MSSETDSLLVFEIKIEKDTEFNKQRGTIITWKNNVSDEDDDIAISFQDKEGVKEIWYNYHWIRKLICIIQNKAFKEESFDFEDDEEEEILPEPTLDNISNIAKEIGASILTPKATKILEHVASDKVIIIINLREEWSNC